MVDSESVRQVGETMYDALECPWCGGLKRKTDVVCESCGDIKLRDIVVEAWGVRFGDVKDRHKAVKALRVKTAEARNERCGWCGGLKKRSELVVCPDCVDKVAKVGDLYWDDSWNLVLTYIDDASCGDTQYARVKSAKAMLEIVYPKDAAPTWP